MLGVSVKYSFINHHPNQQRSKNTHFFLFLEYLILTTLKAITSINKITLQYQATGAKSKQYRRITPTIPCVKRFFQSVKYIFKASIIFILTLLFIYPRCYSPEIITMPIKTILLKKYLIKSLYPLYFHFLIFKQLRRLRRNNLQKI